MKRCLALAFLTLWWCCTASAQRPAPACSEGATLAEIEFEAVSEYFMCGTVGPVEVVVRARVIRVLAGPRLGRTFLGVIVCPGPNVDPGVQATMCIGEPVPAYDRSRMDDFAADPRPRRYMRYAGR